MNNTPSPAGSAVSKIASLVVNSFHKDLVLGAIFILITALYAILMFTDRVPILGLVGLLGLWLIHSVLGGRLTHATPIDMPLIALLGLLPFSLAVSVDWNLSLPKVYGLILGIALFYLIVNTVRDYQRLRLAILGLVLLALGTALLGLFSANWADHKVFDIPQVYDRLPHLIAAIPRNQGGINPNTFGGALTFFVPLLTGLLLDGGAFQRKYLAHHPHPNWALLVYKLFLLTALTVVSATLLLTQSRSAYLGAAAGMLALAIWRDRRFLILLPILLVVFFAALRVLGEGNFAQLLSLMDTTRDPSIRFRLESWQGTVAMIQDFPFTGTGIGTYGHLYSDLYRFNPFTFPETDPFAAHNTLLSVAVDLGLPALVLYTATLSGLASMFSRPIKTSRSIIKVLLIGLACGVLAHQVFGMMDAFVLGTKLGVIQWIFFGLAAAIITHRRNFHWHSPMTAERRAKPEQVKVLRSLENLGLGLALWLLLSLVAVTFINLSPYLSIVLAIAGGILLGIYLTQRHKFWEHKEVA
ncbi:MAG: O-antigen ligase family protein [Anaerolineaceae bacterium]|nr:O-antigen ligase family protein [Anaerolineaceae bacterium]